MATGGAGTSSTRKLIHYTPTPISTLQNSSSSVQRKITEATGKPAGFWYAYDTDWKIAMYNIRTNISRPKSLYKYTLTIPQSLITEDLASLDGGLSRKMIYRLTPANYKEFFSVYYDKKYKLTPWDIVRKAAGSDGSLEQILYDTHPDLLDDGIRAITADQFEEGTREYMIVKIVNEGYNPDEFEDEEYENKIIDSIANELQKENAYRVLDYNWYAFWAHVSEEWGGIEFPEWISSISEVPIGSEMLQLPWTNALLVTPDKPLTTGVLFKPKTFLAENGLTLVGPETIAMGGRRRSRHPKRRQTKRGRGTQKSGH